MPYKKHNWTETSRQVTEMCSGLLTEKTGKLVYWKKKITHFSITPKHFWRKRKFHFPHSKLTKTAWKEILTAWWVQEPVLFKWYGWRYKGGTPNRTSLHNCWNAKQLARNKNIFHRKAKEKMTNAHREYSFPEAPERFATRSPDPAYCTASRTTRLLNYLLPWAYLFQLCFLILKKRTSKLQADSEISCLHYFLQLSKARLPLILSSLSNFQCRKRSYTSVWGFLLKTKYTM